MLSLLHIGTYSPRASNAHSTEATHVEDQRTLLCLQVLRGSRQQTAAGGKQAGILLEQPDEDAAMSDVESEEAEGSGAAEQEREQAAGSYVASLLQQTSLEDRPGRPSLLSR